MIIATAGHVDHGKTTLIRALTGQDTDSQAEEKHRGLSIDLGFAWSQTEQGHWLGFIDVPGHEKFIRNMVAGVAAIDAVMLVIAADDGPMPQTREHLAILDLLVVRKGVVVLSRIDRADLARQKTVRDEIQQLLAETRLANAPLFPVSGMTGQGIPELKAWLTNQVAAVSQSREVPLGGTRFSVDRSFPVAGRGCVVTGTLIAGQLHGDDALILSPVGGRARVRGLEIHGDEVSRVTSGQRCAINLVGDIHHADIRRGDWLVAPWLNRPTKRLDVSLDLLPGSRVHRGIFQVHLGAAVRTGRIVALQAEQNRGGGLAQIVLDNPVHACVRDRILIRDPAVNQTVGGGEILDPFAPSRGRASPERTELLQMLRTAGSGADSVDSAVERMAAWLTTYPAGVDLNQFASAENQPDDRLQQLLARLDVIIMNTSSGPVAVAAGHWQLVKKRTVDRLNEWHRDYPDQAGPAESDLFRAPGIRLAPEIGHRLLRELLSEGLVVRHGFRYRRPEHQPVLTAPDQRRLSQVLAELEGTGLKPPIAGELAEALGLERDAMLEFLQRMHQLGFLVAVAPNRFYQPETVTRLAALAVELAEQSPTGAFDARAYRDRAGIGRRLTVSVLEFLDRAGVTTFNNDERRLQPAYRRALTACEPVTEPPAHQHAGVPVSPAGQQ